MKLRCTIFGRGYSEETSVAADLHLMLEVMSLQIFEANS